MPYRDLPNQDQCQAHVPKFDYDDVKDNKLDAYQVREKYPRFYGVCNVCGYSGIAYASMLHYLSGDW